MISNVVSLIWPDIYDLMLFRVDMLLLLLLMHPGWLAPSCSIRSICLINIGLLLMRLRRSIVIMRRLCLLQTLIITAAHLLLLLRATSVIVREGLVLLVLSYCWLINASQWESSLMVSKTHSLNGSEDLHILCYWITRRSIIWNLNSYITYGIYF